MQLQLYTAGVSQADLSSWVENISIVSQAGGIDVYRLPIQGTLESLQEQMPVVLDELCTAPDERIEFCATHEEGLRAFAYKSYQSRLGKGWNVCLYAPSKEGNVMDLLGMGNMTPGSTFLPDQGARTQGEYATPKGVEAERTLETVGQNWRAAKLRTRTSRTRS